MTNRPRLGAVWTLIALVVLVAVGAASAGAAEDETTPAEAPSKWRLDVLPYAWATGTYGSLNVDGHRVEVDVTPSDVLKILFHGNAFAAAGYFELAYDRFSIFSDTIGGYAEVRVNEEIPTQLCTLSVRAKDKVKFVIGDVGFGYRLGQWSLPGRRRPFTLGVYTGARYMYLSSKLNAAAGVVGGVQKSANVSETIAWADPLIGVRWSLPLFDWASLDFRGDIGGFGASSDLVWGLVGMTRISLPWKPFSTKPYLAAGYRVVAFDRSKTDDSVDLQFRGPLLGAGFTF
jgi:hypothetical protein